LARLLCSATTRRSPRRLRSAPSTTQESPRIWETKPDQGDRALDWQHVYVFTGRTPGDLAAAGVHAGTRVCVDRSKRDLVEFGDYVGAYFLDDRAAVTALLRAARLLHDRGLAPQPATLGAFMSDASHSKASGPTPRAGLLCLPTLSTHGFEVIPRAAIDDMAGIVTDFLSQPHGVV
jgi:putative aminopeptidase FrvX